LSLRTYYDFHLFCGAGGVAIGMARGHARIGRHQARIQCIGGVDSDPEACADFTRHTGVPATCVDMFDAQQYHDFHGRPPPEGWEEATPDTIRAAAGGLTPNIVTVTAPCKGFSGLLNKKSARSRKYQALNQLTLRGVFLMLEAWADDPPELVLFENVPLIASPSKGRRLLESIKQLLESYGYAARETFHDCGEIGGLAQHRRRFLLVARHEEKVAPFLYEPPKQRVRNVGEVLGEFPLPNTEGVGPMHQLAALKWKTWLRLALIEPGKDWRYLQQLEVLDGYLKDHKIAPMEANWHTGPLGVTPWKATATTITGRGGPTNGAFNIADPRLKPGRFNNVFRIVRFDEPSPAVTGGGSPSAGGLAIADPRPRAWRGGRKTFEGGGHYGIVAWDSTMGTVTGHAHPDRGYFSVGDVRIPDPAKQAHPVPVIRSLWGTWNRPYTPLELAALQGFPVALDMKWEGEARSRWVMRIGNAVPPPAGEAIGSTMAHTLLLNDLEVTELLHATPRWVDPAVAIPLTLGG